MKIAAVKKQQASSVELQEAFAALYAELGAECAQVQASVRKFQHAQPSTEAYDQAWADLYVSLNVLETKAHALQEILDQISEEAGDED